MNSLAIVLGLMGLGIGLCFGWVFGHMQGRREEQVLTARNWPEPQTEVYFGEDYDGASGYMPGKRPPGYEDEHPGDIERAWSRPPVPGAGRAEANRYDGMTDSDAKAIEAGRLLT